MKTTAAAAVLPFAVAGQRAASKTITPSVSAELEALIADHATADQHFEEAAEAESELTAQYHSKNPPKMLSSKLWPKDKYNKGEYSLEDFKRGIDSYHSFAGFTIAALTGIDARLADEVRKVVAREKARDIRAIQNYRRAEIARRQRFGLATAAKRTRAAMKVEREARAALIGYRCKSLDEVHRKAAYLLSSNVYPDGLAFDAHDVVAAFSA